MVSVGRLLAVLLMMLTAVFSLNAQTQHRSEALPNSCQIFAQQFYDWYMRLGPPGSQQLSASSALGVPAGVALRDRPDWFSKELRVALQRDLAAQASADDIVGIDFDPFFGSQDPADHYVVRRPAVRNSRCSVQIWEFPRVISAEKTDKPDVVAELELHDGRWKFTDFLYPGTKLNLLQILAELRQEREKQPPEH